MSASNNKAIEDAIKKLDQLSFEQVDGNQNKMVDFNERQAVIRDLGLDWEQQKELIEALTETGRVQGLDVGVMGTAATNRALGLAIAQYLQPAEIKQANAAAYETSAKMAAGAVEPKKEEFVPSYAAAAQKLGAATMGDTVAQKLEESVVTQGLAPKTTETSDRATLLSEVDRQIRTNEAVRMYLLEEVKAGNPVLGRDKNSPEEQAVRDLIKGREGVSDAALSLDVAAHVLKQLPRTDDSFKSIVSDNRLLEMTRKFDSVKPVAPASVIQGATPTDVKDKPVESMKLDEKKAEITRLVNEPVVYEHLKNINAIDGDPNISTTRTKESFLGLIHESTNDVLLTAYVDQYRDIEQQALQKPKVSTVAGVPVETVAVDKKAALVDEIMTLRQDPEVQAHLESVWGSNRATEEAARKGLETDFTVEQLEENKKFLQSVAEGKSLASAPAATVETPTAVVVETSAPLPRNVMDYIDKPMEIVKDIIAQAKAAVAPAAVAATSEPAKPAEPVAAAPVAEKVEPAVDVATPTEQPVAAVASVLPQDIHVDIPAAGLAVAGQATTDALKVSAAEPSLWTKLKEAFTAVVNIDPTMGGQKPEVAVATVEAVTPVVETAAVVTTDAAPAVAAETPVVADPVATVESDTVQPIKLDTVGGLDDLASFEGFVKGEEQEMQISPAIHTASPVETLLASNNKDDGLCVIGEPEQKVDIYHVNLPEKVEAVQAVLQGLGHDIELDRMFGTEVAKATFAELMPIARDAGLSAQSAYEYDDAMQRALENHIAKLDANGSEDAANLYESLRDGLNALNSYELENGNYALDTVYGESVVNAKVTFSDPVPCETPAVAADAPPPAPPPTRALSSGARLS